MRILLRIIVTSILLIAGICLLGQDIVGSGTNENMNDEILGLMLLAAAWVFNVWQGPKVKRGNIAALMSKEIERNIKALERELNLDSPPAKRIELAEMYLRINRPQKTLDILEEYDKNVAENIHSNYLRIIAHFGLKDYRSAWEYVEKVFAKDPNYDNHKIKIWAARCYIELLEPENALNMVDEYTRNAGHVAEAYYVKGVAFARLGRIDDAQTQKDELDNLSSMVQKVRRLEIRLFSKALEKEIQKINSSSK